MSGTAPVPPPAAGDPSMADILASIRRILSEDEPVAAAPPIVVEPAKAQAVDRHEAARHSPAAEHDDDVLVLDRSMMVEAPVVAPVSSNAPTSLSHNVHAFDPPATADPDLLVEEEPVAAVHPATAAHVADETPPSVAAEVTPEFSTKMPEFSPVPVHRPIPEPHPVVVPPPLPEGVSQKAAWPEPVPALAEQVTVATAASSLVNLVRSVAAERTASIQRNGLSIEDVVREEVRPLLKAWLDMHLPPLVERLVQAEIERVVNRAGS